MPRYSPHMAQILLLLSERRAAWFYGYDLSKTLQLKSGTLYPLLIRLESEGWLESCWDDSTPKRHMYRLTEQGSTLAQAWLEKHPQRVQALKGALA